MGKSDWDEGEGGTEEIRQHSFHGDKPGVGDEYDEIKQRGQYVAIVRSVNPFLASAPALFVFNPLDRLRRTAFRPTQIKRVYTLK
ncbi:hypothetical protein [Pseudomonas petrae]|uniref:Uncharacterized protein n=1 Tax=Pseudomonas petrae TaxID=2912190 RepID=A0ABS9I7W1_9PSED|nr:hypothetical protein [Pseudomonas petrae]MCF7532139.1 hypothetical protein [Pseudomonas petrae]MCF7537672.1 hypothetical protein [Pseudomonas petrae]MCF7543464.1 hypothetical protein [Pseudomonas petrae]MCF7556608.1 hypothetical protein [Pseudomonas petrae]